MAQSIDQLLAELSVGGAAATSSSSASSFAPSSAGGESEIDNLLSGLSQQSFSSSSYAVSPSTDYTSSPASTAGDSDADAMLASFGIGGATGISSTTASGTSSQPSRVSPVPGMLRASDVATVNVTLAVPSSAPPTVAEAEAAVAALTGASAPVFKDRNHEITSALSTVSALISGMQSGELQSLAQIVGEKRAEISGLPDYLDPSLPEMSDEQFADMAELMGDLADDDVKAMAQEAKGRSGASRQPLNSQLGVKTAKKEADGAFDTLNHLLDGTNLNEDTRRANKDTDDLLDMLAGQDLADY